MQYKILIVGLAWVGDAVMSQTLFKELNQQYNGQLIIDVLANEWTGNILSRMKEVNNVIIHPFKHGKFQMIERIKISLKLRHNNYNQAFILPFTWKSAIIPYFAKIKKRTGFIGELRYGLINDIYKLDKTKLPKMIDQFCALANKGKKPAKILLPELRVDKNNQLELIKKFNFNNDKLIALCPAAEYGPAKRWPVENYALVANMLIDNGYKIIILGSVKDKLISSEIKALIKKQEKVVDTCGKTTLMDTVDILALAQYVITNDSGLMHIAAAVGSNVIAIYGSSSPKYTPPLSQKAQIIRVPLDCSPCLQRTCRFGHYNCLKFITPEVVFSKISLEENK